MTIVEVLIEPVFGIARTTLANQRRYGWFGIATAQWLSDAYNALGIFIHAVRRFIFFPFNLSILSDCLRRLLFRQVRFLWLIDRLICKPRFSRRRLVVGLVLVVCLLLSAGLSFSICLQHVGRSGVIFGFCGDALHNHAFFHITRQTLLLDFNKKDQHSELSRRNWYKLLLIKELQIKVAKI